MSCINISQVSEDLLRIFLKKDEKEFKQYIIKNVIPYSSVENQSSEIDENLIEVQKDLREFVNRNPSFNSFYTNVLQYLNPKSWEDLKDIEYSEQKPLFEEVADTTSSFLNSIFGILASAQFETLQQTTSQLITELVWDKENKILINDLSLMHSRLNTYLKNQMEVINNLFKLNLNPEVYNSYTDFFDALFNSEDPRIQLLLTIGTDTDSKDLLQASFDRKAGSLPVEGVKAFLRVKYLDNFINHIFKGYIAIHPGRFGKYNMDTSRKYTYTNEAHLVFAANDELIDIDANTEILTKLIISSLPLYKYNSKSTTPELLSESISLQSWKNSIGLLKDFSYGLSDLTIKNGFQSTAFNDTSNVWRTIRDSKSFTESEKEKLKVLVDSNSCTIGDLISLAPAYCPKLMLKTFFYILFNPDINFIGKFLSGAKENTTSFLSRRGELGVSLLNTLYSIYKGIFELDSLEREKAKASSIQQCDAISSENRFASNVNIFEAILQEIISTGEIAVGGYTYVNGVLLKQEYSAQSSQRIRWQHEGAINSTCASITEKSFQKLLDNAAPGCTVSADLEKKELILNFESIDSSRPFTFAYNVKTGNYSIKTKNGSSVSASELLNDERFQSITTLIFDIINLKTNSLLKETLIQNPNEFLKLFGRISAGLYDYFNAGKDVNELNAKESKDKLIEKTPWRVNPDNLKIKIVHDSCLELLDSVSQTIIRCSTLSLSSMNKDASGDLMSDIVLSNKLANLRTTYAVAKIFHKDSPINHFSLMRNNLLCNVIINRDMKNELGTIKKITAMQAKELFEISFLADFLEGIHGEEDINKRYAANGRRIGVLAGVFSDKPAISHIYLDLKEKGFPVYDSEGNVKERKTLSSIIESDNSFELITNALFYELGNYYKSQLSNINNTLIKAFSAINESTDTIYANPVECYKDLIKRYKSNQAYYDLKFKEYNQANPSPDKIITITHLIDDKINDSIIHEYKKYSSKDTYKEILKLHEAAFLVSLFKSDVAIDLAHYKGQSSSGKRYVLRQYSDWVNSYNCASEDVQLGTLENNLDNSKLNIIITESAIRALHLKEIKEDNSENTEEEEENESKEALNAVTYTLSVNGKNYKVNSIQYSNLTNKIKYFKTKSSKNLVFTILKEQVNYNELAEATDSAPKRTYYLTDYDWSSIQNLIQTNPTDTKGLLKFIYKNDNKEIEVYIDQNKLQSLRKFKKKNNTISLKDFGTCFTDNLNSIKIVTDPKEIGKAISYTPNKIKNGKMALARIEYTDKSGKIHYAAVTTPTEFLDLLQYMGGNATKALSNPSILLEEGRNVTITLHPLLLTYNLLSTYAQQELILTEVGSWVAHPDKGMFSKHSFLEQFYATHPGATLESLCADLGISIMKDTDDNTAVKKSNSDLEKELFETLQEKAYSNTLEENAIKEVEAAVNSDESIEEANKEQVKQNILKRKTAVIKDLKLLHHNILEATAAFKKTAQDKRNVIFTALKKLLLLDQINGVPDQIKYAVLEDITTKCYTPAGDIGKATPFDGATFAHPIFHILFNNSLNAAKVGVDLKGFSSFYDFNIGIGGIMKTANFSLTNELMKKSDFYRTMCFNMMKHRWKTKDGADWNSTTKWGVFSKIGNSSESLWAPDVFYKINNDFYKRELTGFDATKLVYTFNDIKVNSRGVPTGEVISGIEIQITDNFSLFDALGSWNRVSKNSEGLLTTSEESIKDLANLAIQTTELVYDSPEEVAKLKYKHQVHQPLLLSDILLGITEGAVKFGAVNTNSKSVYTDNIMEKDEITGKKVFKSNSNYNFAFMPADDLGPQLDKEHHADDSEIANMTLVISAAASRGFTPWECMELYNSLASISKENTLMFRDEDNNIFDTSEESLNKYLNILISIVCDYLLRDNSSDPNLLKDLTLDFILKLKRNKLILDENLLNEFKENIPINHPNIYGKIFSILTSTLTKTAIKTKVGGSLSVLNPTHSIIKFYNVPKELPNFSQEWYDMWNSAVITLAEDQNIYSYKKLYNYLVKAKNTGDLNVLLEKFKETYDSIPEEIVYKKVQSNEIPQIRLGNSTCNVSTNEFLKIIDSLLDIITDPLDIEIGLNYEIIVPKENIDSFEREVLRILNPKRDINDEISKDERKILDKLKFKDDPTRYWANILLPNSDIYDNNSIGRNLLKSLLNSNLNIACKKLNSAGNDLKSYDVKGEFIDLETNTTHKFALSDLDSVQTLCKIKRESESTKWNTCLTYLQRIKLFSYLSEKLRYDLDFLLKKEENLKFNPKLISEESALEGAEEEETPKTKEFNNIATFYAIAQNKLIESLNLGIIPDLEGIIQVSLEEYKISNPRITEFSLEKIKKLYSDYLDLLLTAFVEKVYQDDLFRLSGENIQSISNITYIDGKVSQIDTKSLKVLKYGILMPKVNKTDLNLPEDCLPEDVISDKYYFNKLLKRTASTEIKNVLIKTKSGRVQVKSLWDLELKNSLGNHVYISRSKIPGYTYKKNLNYYKCWDEDSKNWVMRSILTNNIVYYLADENDEVYQIDGKYDLIITTKPCFTVDGVDTNEVFDSKNPVKYSQLTFNPYDWYIKHIEHVGFNLSSITSTYSKNYTYLMIDEALSNSRKDKKMWGDLKNLAFSEVKTQLNYDNLSGDALKDAKKNLNDLVKNEILTKVTAVLNAPIVRNSSEYAKIYSRAIETQANTLRNSFLHSLNIIAARIPAQCLQSVMAMEVEGFVDVDLNKAFVSIYLFFLQGSDLDIDAVSLLVFSFMEDGTYPSVSPYTNISTPEFARASSKLCIPATKESIKTTSDENLGIKILDLIEEYCLKTLVSYNDYTLWKAWYILANNSEDTSLRNLCGALESYYQYYINDYEGDKDQLEKIGRLKALKVLKDAGVFPDTMEFTIDHIIESVQEDFSNKFESGELITAASVLSDLNIANTDEGVNIDFFKLKIEEKILLEKAEKLKEENPFVLMNNGTDIQLDISTPEKLTNFAKFLRVVNELIVNGDFYIYRDPATPKLVLNFLKIVDKHQTFLQSEKTNIKASKDESAPKILNVIGDYLTENSKEQLDSSKPFILTRGDNNEISGIEINTKTAEARLNLKTFIQEFKENPQVYEGHNEVEKSIVKTVLSKVNRELNKNVKSKKFIDLAYKNHELELLLYIVLNPIHAYEAISSIDIIVDPIKNIALLSDSARDLAFYYVGNCMGQFQGIVANMAGKTGIATCATAEKTFYAFTAVTLFILRSGNADLMKTLLWALPGDKKNFNGDIAGQVTHILANSMNLDFYKDLDTDNFNLKLDLEDSKSRKDFSSSSAYIEQVVRNLLYQGRYSKNAALIISALLSLATDNAKELVLEKINAGPETLDLYLAGAMLGYSFEDLHSIINSKYGKEIAKFMKSDVVSGYSGYLSALGAVRGFEDIQKTVDSQFTSLYSRVWFQRHPVEVSKIILQKTINSLLLNITGRDFIEEFKNAKLTLDNSNLPDKEEEDLKNFLLQEEFFKEDPIKFYFLKIDEDRKDIKYTQDKAERRIISKLYKYLKFNKSEENLKALKERINSIDSIKDLEQKNKKIQEILEELNIEDEADLNRIKRHLNDIKSKANIETFLNLSIGNLYYSDAKLASIDKLRDSLKYARDVSNFKILQLARGAKDSYYNVEQIGKNLAAEIKDPSHANYTEYQDESRAIAADVQSIFDVIDSRLVSIKSKYDHATLSSVYGDYNISVSFHKLALVAAEMKLAGKLLGVNKELKVKETDYRKLINNFENVFITLLSNITNLSEDISKIKQALKNDEGFSQRYIDFTATGEVVIDEHSGLKLNITRFLNDPVYAMNCINFYDSIKICFNLLTPFKCDPHWRAYLDSLAIQQNNKLNAAISILNKYVGDNFISLHKVKDPKTKELIYSNIDRKFNWDLIQEFLSTSEITLFPKKRDNVSVYDSSLLLLENVQLTDQNIKDYFLLNTSSGVLNFVSFVEETLVPRLKQDESLKDNFLVLNFSFKEIISKLSGCTISHRSPSVETLMPKAKDVSGNAIVERLKIDFAKLSSVPFNEIDNPNIRLSVADVLFLYSLIVTGGNPGPTSLILITSYYANLPYTLGNQYYSFISSLSSKLLAEYNSNQESSQLTEYIAHLNTDSDALEAIIPLCKTNDPANGDLIKMKEKSSGDIMIIKPVEKEPTFKGEGAEEAREIYEEAKALQRELEAEYAAEFADVETADFVEGEEIVKPKESIKLRQGLLKSTVNNSGYREHIYSSLGGVLSFHTLAESVHQQTVKNKFFTSIYLKENQNIKIKYKGNTLIDYTIPSGTYLDTDEDFINLKSDINLKRTELGFEALDEKALENLLNCINNCIQLVTTDNAMALENLIFNYIMEPLTELKC